MRPDGGYVIQLKAADAAGKLEASYANPAPLREFIDRQLALPGKPSSSLLNQALDLAVIQRDPDFLARVLQHIPDEPGKPYYSGGVWFPRAYFVGILARLRHDESAAQAVFAEARKEASREVASQPENPGIWSILATIDSELGRHEDALREMRQACELVPAKRDALFGADYEIGLADVEAHAGQIDRAIERLANLTEIPSLISYGDLKLSRTWDPVRSDPRFQALVEKLAPREAKP